MTEQPGQPEAVCPYCRSTFEPEDEVKLCPACATPHHADCFAENGGCTVFGCTAAPAEEPTVSISPIDLTSSPNPAPPPVRSAAPPPPPPPMSMPDGSAAPYQQPAYAAPTYAAPAFPGYAYGSYVRPKSRVAFILLAVFLGSFGAHNFYAGYSKKAAIQLCVSIFTCFWAAPFMWIWGIVEVCTIHVDDDGVLLS